jgi:hypothetical protein
MTRLFSLGNSNVARFLSIATLLVGAFTCGYGFGVFYMSNSHSEAKWGVIAMLVGVAVIVLTSINVGEKLADFMKTRIPSR